MRVRPRAPCPSRGAHGPGQHRGRRHRCRARRGGLEQRKRCIRPRRRPRPERRARPEARGQAGTSPGSRQARGQAGRRARQQAPAAGPARQEVPRPQGPAALAVRSAAARNVHRGHRRARRRCGRRPARCRHRGRRRHHHRDLQRRQRADLDDRIRRPTSSRSAPTAAARHRPSSWAPRWASGARGPPRRRRRSSCWSERSRRDRATPRRPADPAPARRPGPARTGTGPRAGRPSSPSAGLRAGPPPPVPRRSVRALRARPRAAPHRSRRRAGDGRRPASPASTASRASATDEVQTASCSAPGRTKPCTRSLSTSSRSAA